MQHSGRPWAWGTAGRSPKRGKLVLGPSGKLNRTGERHGNHCMDRERRPARPGRSPHVPLAVGLARRAAARRGREPAATQPTGGVTMNGATGKVIVNQTIAADGYSAGPKQSEQRPFGEDGGDGWGDRLHAWMFEEGEENRAEVDEIKAASAVIMGRNMFGPVRGPWDRHWNGWWGDDPP